MPWANGAFTTPAPPDDAPILEVDEEHEENEATTAGLGVYQQVSKKSLSSLVCGEGWGLSSDWLTSHTVAAPAVRATIKTEL